MAITSYATLKTEVATWLARSDQTSNIDTFIDNAEAWFNRNLRVRQMETETTSLTISASGVITHPTGWVSWKSLKVTTAPISNIQIVTNETSNFRNESGSTGRPLFAVVVGDTTELYPVPDSSTAYAYKAIYYKQLTALDGTNTSNWLLTSHSDIYLYGTLWQACMLLQDAQGAQYWQALFDMVVGELQTRSRSDSASGSSMMPRIRTVV